jgi:hypothetical protein
MNPRYTTIVKRLVPMGGRVACPLLGGDPVPPNAREPIN